MNDHTKQRNRVVMLYKKYKDAMHRYKSIQSLSDHMECSICFVDINMHFTIIVFLIADLRHVFIIKFDLET